MVSSEEFPATSSDIIVNVFSPSERVVVNEKLPSLSTTTILSFIFIFAFSSVIPSMTICLCF